MQELFRSKIHSLTFLFTVILTGVKADELSRDQLEKNILTQIYVQSKLNSFVRPRQNGSVFDEPVLVNLSMYIPHLNVDAKNQEFDMTFYFRQEWSDNRLAYDNQGKLSHIALHDVIAFWTPDLFFANEKSAHLHSVTKPNTYTQIYPDGKVFHSQRLSMKASCPMNLKLYPFDKQSCRLRVESYGYTADDLFIEWNEDLSVSGSPQVIGYNATFYFDSSVVTFDNKKYSIAELEIKLERHVTNFIVHLYLPITIFVLASWVPFWLNPKSSFIRMTLSLTTITFSLFQLDMNSYLFVSIGYPTGLDVWTGFSCFLLFSAFFESVYVIYSSQNLENGSKSEDKNVLFFILAKFSTNTDSTAKILFPSAFALFNISYFIYTATCLSAV